MVGDGVGGQEGVAEEEEGKDGGFELTFNVHAVFLPEKHLLDPSSTMSAMASSSAAGPSRLPSAARGATDTREDEEEWLPATSSLLLFLDPHSTSREKSKLQKVSRAFSASYLVTR